MTCNVLSGTLSLRTTTHVLRHLLNYPTLLHCSFQTKIFSVPQILPTIDCSYPTVGLTSQTIFGFVMLNDFYFSSLVVLILVFGVV